MSNSVRKLLLGVDFGTTFSGVSWVSSSEADVDDIKTFQVWPGLGAHRAPKCPSVVAYRSENQGLPNPLAWGYEVKGSMISYAWFKLLLDRKALQTSYDDPNLDAETKVIFGRLLKTRNVEQILTDYLRELYQHTLQELNNILGEALVKTTPIEFFFTVPAIWSDEAKDTTTRAAKAAGFGSRSGDAILMLPEPEAAAIAVLKQKALKYEGTLKVGDGVLICDCGGGTVDITTYSIQQIQPKLSFEEACVGTGGKCGSTTVDRNFLRLMTKRFGTAFTDLGPKNIGPGSKLMQHFIDLKHDFQETERSETREIFLPMKGVEDSAWYEEEDCNILLTTADMREIFDPVIDQILKMVDDQVVDSKKPNSTPIKTVILVGGFGESRYLIQRLKRHLAREDISIVCPPDAWSAIVRGAALRGLEGSVVLKRKCRRNYGTKISSQFDPATDKESDAFTEKWSKQKYSRNIMQWCAIKGQNILPETHFKCDLFVCLEEEDNDRSLALALYTCSLDTAPRGYDNSTMIQVGSISYDFTNEDLTKMEWKWDTSGPSGGRQKIYHGNIAIEMRAGDDAGQLKFLVTANGKTLGTANLDFTK